MKYIIYLAIAALAVWAVVFLIRHIRRQLQGECVCGVSCSGDCVSCGKHCSGKSK